MFAEDHKSTKLMSPTKKNHGSLNKVCLKHLRNKKRVLKTS